MSNTPFSLAGKTIVITGASSGIGCATAVACSKLGARHLFLLGRNETALVQTATQLDAGTEVSVLAGDLCAAATTLALMDMIGRLPAKIHGFVHAAGRSATLPLRQTESADIRALMEVNVLGGVELARRLAHRQVMATAGGSMVFLSSVMGSQGEAGKTAYSLTKGALLGGVKSMAVELASRGIRVNAVSPGVVRTPMVAQAVYSQDAASFARVAGMHPLGVGAPDDVAHAVAFLLSDAARWITGTNLVVDGGYTAQ